MSGAPRDERCELCRSDGGTVFWRNDECRAVLVDEPGYVGYCRVIWNAHVPEMSDLAQAQRQRLMRVVFTLEAALREALRPDKINLASLGNVTPHLHWHVIARFRTDPAFPHPVWHTPSRAPVAVPRPPKLAADLARALSRR